jgi:hypothetical protein
MTSPRRSPLGTVLDVMVYAPIGAFFHGPDVVSELAERGRSDVNNARVIGSMAVAKGLQEAEGWRETATERLEEVLVAVARAAGAPLAGADPTTAPDAGPAADRARGASPPNLRVVADTPEPVDVADAPDVTELAIPDYDNLSASQVVPRLDDLADDELEAVRTYEASHRGRMTILSRIATLQAS